jgi:hypothetical protein
VLGLDICPDAALCHPSEMASNESPGEQRVPASPRAESSSDLQLLNGQLRKLNQELIDGEQRLRLAIETGRIGLWVWQINRHLTFTASMIIFCRRLRA